MSVLASVASSVVASSVVAAFISGYFADRTERRKQLREQRISIAGEFAGDTMTALEQEVAELRRIESVDGVNRVSAVRVLTPE